MQIHCQDIIEPMFRNSPEEFEPKRGWDISGLCTIRITWPLFRENIDEGDSTAWVY